MASQNLGDEVRRRLLPEEDEDLEDEARGEMCHRGLYGTFIPGSEPPVIASGPIASSSTIAAQAAMPSKTVIRYKRYRIVFLITLGFDLGLIVFLSIFSFVNNKDTHLADYFKLSVEDSLFDLVFLSVLRFVLNVLFYLLLGWVTRIVLAVTVIGSTFYIPAKAYIYWSGLVNSETTIPEIQYIIVLLILFASFVLPWFEAFFFEFKFLPAELSRLKSTYWWDWKIWCCPWMLVKRVPLNQSSQNGANTTTGTQPRFTQIRQPTPHWHSSVDTLFRTPIGGTPATSPTAFIEPDNLLPIREEDGSSSSTELQPPECDQLSPTDIQCLQKAQDTQELVYSYTSSNEGWSFHKEQNGITIYCRRGPTRKIWKSEMILNHSVEKVFHNVYQEYKKMPQWNPSVIIIEMVHRIDRWTDVMYTVSAAVGPISERDFVTVRRADSKNGCHYVASVSVEFDGRPPASRRVRGENGPSGYAIVPYGENQSKYIWILDIDPKMWIMQAILDQTYAGILINANAKLRTYLDTV